ncbi:MAG: alpha/beta hydrolase [Chloroflexota bacterium]
MKPRAIHRLRYVLPLGGALASGALGVAAYTSHVINRPRRATWRDDFTFTPWEVQVPHDVVDFETADGVRLRGWWLTRPESARTVICCTGHRGLKQDLLGIGTGLWRAGNNVLLFDFRGCGDSDLVPLSLAYHELLDARAAIRFVQERNPGAHIGLVGYSMGAAVSILVAAEDPSIRVVVADSSFATMRDVVAFAIRRHRLPAHPIVGLSDLFNYWRHGYRFSAVKPIDAIGRMAPRPVLIIHGEEDSVTPVDNAYRLFEAAREPKELWVVPGARHCGAYFAHRQTYVRRVSEFVGRSLAASHAPAPAFQGTGDINHATI